MATLNPDVILEALAPKPAPILPDLREQEPPKDDAPKRRGLRRAPRQISADEPCVTADEIPDMIRDTITTYLADPLPEAMLLISTPAGTGKTTVLVELAEQRAAASDRVLYAGPNHDFFSDVQALAAHPAWWYEWQGRHDGKGIGLDATCRWTHQIEQWMQRGYQARGFCANARICGWNYVHSGCRYYAQAGRTEPIIYAQHQHVALGHLLMDRMSLVIGDELPLSAFLTNTDQALGWRIPPAHIAPPGTPGPLGTLLAALQRLTATRMSWSGPDLLTHLGGAAHVAAILADAAVDGALAAEPDLHSANDVEDAPYFHLFTLARLLGQEARAAVEGRACISRVRVDGRGLTLLVRRVPRALPPHVIWGDATGDARLYERLFQRPVVLLRPRARMRGRVFQVWASLNNKGSLIGEGVPVPIARAALPDAPASASQPKPANVEKQAKLRQQIRRIIERGGYTNPALISYKHLSERLAEGAAADNAIGHFGAHRGTNRYEDCDCLIVVGAQQPSLPAMLDTAAMIYQERTEPFDATWSVLDRPYAGQNWSWPIGGFWNDPDLQTLLEQFRESELLQAIHRARPIRRAVDVWLLTNVPLPDLPVELVSLHELFDAPAGVEPYRWPEIVALAEAQIARAGLVTSADLVKAGLCTQNIAAKYIPVLAHQQGWQIITAPASGRGKPPLACVKR